MRNTVIRALIVLAAWCVVASGGPAQAATGYYAQNKDGTIEDLGNAVPFTYPYWSGQNIAKDIAVKNSGSTGYWLLDRSGGIFVGGNATNYGGPSWPGQDVARAIDNTPSEAGYYVLDQSGGISFWGNASNLGGPSWPGQDVARDIAAMPSGSGYYVLDKSGGVHAFGNAVFRGSPSWPGQDIARAIAVTPDGSGYYVLDRSGGLHTFGNAVNNGNPYWSGQDVARDISVAANGKYYILDKTGGVHVFGGAADHGDPTLYPGQDVYKRLGYWKSDKWSGQRTYNDLDSQFSPSSGEAQIYAYTSSGTKRIAPKARRIKFTSTKIQYINDLYTQHGWFFTFDISVNDGNDTGVDAIDPGGWATNFPGGYKDRDDDPEIVPPGNNPLNGNGFNDETEVTALRPWDLDPNVDYYFHPYFNAALTSGVTSQLEWTAQMSGWSTLWQEYNVITYNGVTYTDRLFASPNYLSVPWSGIVW